MVALARRIAVILQRHLGRWHNLPVRCGAKPCLIAGSPTRFRPALQASEVPQGRGSDDAVVWTVAGFCQGRL